MKKLILSASIIALLASCSTSKGTSEVDANVDYAVKYAATITEKDLAKHLFIYASDEFEGRNTGEPGQKKAAKYLKDFYVKEGIASALGGDDYFQEVPASFLNKGRKRGAPLKDSEDSNNMYEGMSSESSPKPDKELMKESLRREIERSLSTLTPREADVIRLYFGLSGKHPMTLEEIGEKFDLTRERVRQIKEKSIRRLKHTSRSKLLKSYLG